MHRVEGDFLLLVLQTHVHGKHVGFLKGFVLCLAILTAGVFISICLSDFLHKGIKLEGMYLANFGKLSLISLKVTESALLNIATIRYCRMDIPSKVYLPDLTLRRVSQLLPSNWKSNWCAFCVFLL